MSVTVTKTQYQSAPVALCQAPQNLLFQTFCGRRMRWKVTKLEHNSNWFYKLGFQTDFRQLLC